MSRCPLRAVTCACTELQKIEQERTSHEQRQQASPGEPDNERAEARASLDGSDAGAAPTSSTKQDGEASQVLRSTLS